MWKTTVSAGGFCIAAVLLAGAATAETPADGSAVTRSTPDLRAHLSQRLDFRADVSDDPYPTTPLDKGSGTHRVDGMGRRVLMDWRFDTAGLRLTGGALQERERHDHGAIALGQEREPRQLFSSEGDWRPYVGLGWDSALGRQNQLDIQLDMGLMFRSMEGSEDVETAGQPSLLNGDAFLHREFESFRYQPTISADLEYRF